MSLVVGDSDGRQVDCQVLLQHVVELHIFLELGAHRLFLNRIFLFACLAFEHGAESEFVSVEFIDVLREGYNLFLSVALPLVALVFHRNCLLECFETPRLALDPVVDVREWIGVLLSHHI